MPIKAKKNNTPKIRSWLLFYMRNPSNPNGKEISMCLPVIPEIGYDEVIKKFAPEMLPYKDSIRPIETWEIPDPIFAPHDNWDGFSDVVNYEHIIGYSDKKYHTPVNKKKIKGYQLDRETEHELAIKMSNEIKRLMELTAWPGDDSIHSEMLGCIIINQAYNVLPQGEYDLSDEFANDVREMSGICIR